jgi:hypothetical protein
MRVHENRCVSSSGHALACLSNLLPDYLILRLATEFDLAQEKDFAYDASM